jgi:hypothetical protein
MSGKQGTPATPFASITLSEMERVEALLQRRGNPLPRSPMCSQCLYQQGCRMHMLGIYLGTRLNWGQYECLLEQWEAIEAAFPLPFEGYQGRYSIDPGLYSC